MDKKNVVMSFFCDDEPYGEIVLVDGKVVSTTVEHWDKELANGIATAMSTAGSVAVFWRGKRYSWKIESTSSASVR